MRESTTTSPTDNDFDCPIPTVAPFDLHFADEVVGVIPSHSPLIHSAIHNSHPVTIVGLNDAQQSPPSSSSMADTGANVCITSDESILIDVVDIDPIPLGVAVKSSDITASLCSRKGFLQIPLLDGSYHYQPFLVNPNASDTILSPAHVMWSSHRITKWQQSGSKDPLVVDTLLFMDADGNDLLVLPLTSHNGLQYCSHDTPPPHTPVVRSCITYSACSNSTSSTSSKRALEAELWAARLGFCSEWQLAKIPLHADGTPTKFYPHPLRFVTHKEMARVRKQPAGSDPDRAILPGQRFLMDFGFMRASASDYSSPNLETDRVVESFDGYVAYLIIVDEASKFVWIFPRKSKEPPVDLVSHFLHMYGRHSGGVIRCDQGGELARSAAFRTTMMEKHLYAVEPTGADSPSQNGGAEKWNDSLAVTTRALLYGASLPAKYWSAALTHAAYIHNRRVHHGILCTPFEKWYGRKPDLRKLRVFGSRVCVKRTGSRRAKLDQHSFSGVFIGYTATDSNVRYIDVHTGIVKTSHHAVFDECWFHQPWRPPAAQLLYELGNAVVNDLPDPPPVEPSTLPPSPTITSSEPHPSTPTPLHGELPTSAHPITQPDDDAVSVATTSSSTSSRVMPPLKVTSTTTITNPDASAVDRFGISHNDISQVYFSPHHFGYAFEDTFEYMGSASTVHATAGLELEEVDNRVFIRDIAAGTPCAKIPRWKTRLRNTCLLAVNGSSVTSISDVKAIISNLPPTNRGTCRLLVSASEIRDGLTNDGIPQLTLDQLNPRHFFKIPSHTGHHSNTALARMIHQSWDGGVLHYITWAHKLTRGVLLKQADWDDWQKSEFLQLDQYELQGMFGDPVLLSNGNAVFNLVWTYAVKEVDGRKKARCTCDGSTRGGQVRVLDYTYANSPDHTCSRIFYALAAAENLVIYGADVSNAFAEAPPPKQGFFIRPDAAFKAWWTVHKGRPPIQDNYVIPILSAMQGHPEAPRLWEKHADKILRSIGLFPTTHEPCLYSGLVDGQRVLLLRQVDDFAVAAPSDQVASTIFDLIDDHLTIPLKRLGLISLFNGIDIVQTKHFIKLSCKSYVERICEKYLDGWLGKHFMPSRPTPLPQSESFMKSFLSAVGDSSDAAQARLEKDMGIKYRNGLGELIYALVTCRPDLSYAVVKCAQATVCPHEIHYHALRHIMKYLYTTRNDGIYFWRQQLHPTLPSEPLPAMVSRPADLLPENRPSHLATDLHGYVDSDWATCPRTRRSLTGVCVRLAGGTIAYKTKLQPTIAQSSTEAEFMGASDFGKILLYVRSVLWDLGVPQHAASILYEDNDACTAMAMAQKPTPRTRHMDIKYQVICEWVERDLLHLKRIHTSVNLADLFTKHLATSLFYRHTDYVLGHVPPHYTPTSTSSPTSEPTPRTNASTLFNLASVWSSIAHNPFGPPIP